VISETLREKPDAVVVAWIAELPEESVCLPALVVGELQKGIELLEPGARRDALRLWLEQLQQRFAGRILAVDAETALQWGCLYAKMKKAGTIVPVVDGLLAATALRHQAVLATRNTADFQPTGIRLLNPWEHGAAAG
jgi:toxin FitB